MANEPKDQGATLVRNEEEVREPDEYRVILLNDDYTTMEFVVSVLISVFHKALPEAQKIDHYDC